ncbi:Hsp20/alpha crystallin family protein [Kallotenue papyrolyticum]|uniref:Hsp20/alpha crystallin family protein n=1 Tax=Kallotenue papyrolyticum TaxID=1325125 RepID=UPI000478530D|nr:Hsp20/alpha crystallin family protein [Kallotenue papyrolyticum]
MTTAINRVQNNNLSLRDAFDRLFAEAWVRPFGLFGRQDGTRRLPVDLFENDDAYVVRAFVPGVAPEQVEITAQGNTLTIRAQQQIEEQPEACYYLRERVGGTWVRTIELPGAFDSNAAEAKLEHGVLWLTLPKTPESKPQRITIKAN